MRDEQERTIRGVLSDAKDQTADIADQVKGAARASAGQRLAGLRRCG